MRPRYAAMALCCCCRMASLTVERPATSANTASGINSDGIWLTNCANPPAMQATPSTTEVFVVKCEEAALQQVVTGKRQEHGCHPFRA